MVGFMVLSLGVSAPLTDGRLLLAADDSLNPKTGKQIHGCDYHFDHAAKINQAKYRWIQNIVRVGLLKWIHGRYAYLPLAWCFYQLQKTLGVQIKMGWVYYKEHYVVLFATDLSLSVEKVIEYYSARRKIESSFKELKQEIGSKHAQACNQQAVTNHLNFCMMVVTFIWIYAARLSQMPQRRYAVARRDICFQRTFHEKNNLISTILKIAA